MNITGRIIGGDKLLASTNAFSSRMMVRLRAVVARLAIDMVVRVKGKLTDDVLHVRSGRLRRSITFKLENGPNTAKAVVGTKVEYARAHEYGFNGVVSVREYMRQTKLGEPVMVRQHQRQMNLPERSFLRSTLADMKDEINQRMSRAITSGEVVS